jgi:hypothetical protein
LASKAKALNYSTLKRHKHSSLFGAFVRYEKVKTAPGLEIYLNAPEATELNSSGNSIISIPVVEFTPLHCLHDLRVGPISWSGTFYKAEQLVIDKRSSLLAHL